MIFLQKTTGLIFLYLLCIVVDLTAQSVFQKSFGHVSGSQANAVIQTQEGGYAIAGWYDVEGLFSAEFYLILTDATGDTLWTRTYGKRSDTTSFALNGSGNEGYNLIQTHDGGFLFIGERHEIPGGTSDVFALRIDPNGALLWSRMYGGDDNEYGVAVAQSADGNFVIGGFTETFGAGIRDMLLMKVDETGDTLWTKTFGGESIDAALDMKQTLDGGYVLAGYTFSDGAGSSDIYVVRTDSEGNVIWQRTYGGTLNDIGHAIIETSDGGFSICGETESFGVGNRDIYLIKVDVNGNVEWSKAFGGEDYEAANAIVQANDGGFVLAGYTRGYGAGGEDFIVLKTDAQGQYTWSGTYGGKQDDAAKSIINADDNGFVVTGYSRSFSNGGLDVYLVKTDSLGASSCGEFINNINTTDLMSITKSPNFEVGYGTVIKQRTTVVGRTNTIIQDPCDIINVVAEFVNLTQWQVHPNPANNFLVIDRQDGDAIEEKQIEIHDLLGRQMQSISFDPHNNQIDISRLATGAYVLTIRTNNLLKAKMFIKQ